MTREKRREVAGCPVQIGGVRLPLFGALAVAISAKTRKAAVGAEARVYDHLRKVVG